MRKYILILNYVYDMALRHVCEGGLARSISKELGEEWTEQGQRIVPTLQRLAKIMVRRALAADGMCIQKKSLLG